MRTVLTIDRPIHQVMQNTLVGPIYHSAMFSCHMPHLVPNLTFAGLK